jgi:hypothetical protein
MGILDGLGDAASQVGGFFKGAGETLWETGEGVVALGGGILKTGYDLSPAGYLVDGVTAGYGQLTGSDAQAPGWMPSAERGGERMESAADVVVAIARNPGLLVDAVIEPIIDDWNNGNYGEAIGRGTTEVLLAVVGTKGIDKAAKGAGVAGDVADVARAGNRIEDLAGTARHGLGQSQIDEITAIAKGSRPAPEEYLSPSYIADHLAQFEGGATRFQLRSGLDKYGPGQVDGTSFVMPRHEADRLLAQTAGDPRALEDALGLPAGQLDGGEQLMRVDFADPAELDVRIPSGNEAGANAQWIPGGKLPEGGSEAVIDVGGLDPARYTATAVDP